MVLFKNVEQDDLLTQTIKFLNSVVLVAKSEKKNLLTHFIALDLAHSVDSKQSVCNGNKCRCFDLFFPFAIFFFFFFLCMKDNVSNLADNT